jgi:hypothetical protein
MNEQGFVILKRERETPSLAMCQRCEIKFFTPHELANDPTEAEVFLRGRFMVHKCKALDFLVRAQRAVNQ